MQAAVVAKMAVAHHQQLPASRQMAGRLLKQPQGNVIAHHAALMERRIEKNEVKLTRTFVDTVAVMELRLGIKTGSPDITSGTRDRLTGDITEHHVHVCPLLQHFQPEHPVTASQIQHARPWRQ